MFTFSVLVSAAQVKNAQLIFPLKNFEILFSEIRIQENLLKFLFYNVWSNANRQRSALLCNQAKLTSIAKFRN